MLCDRVQHVSSAMSRLHSAKRWSARSGNKGDVYVAPALIDTWTLRLSLVATHFFCSVITRILQSCTL